jgi:hypothetical protein
MKRFWIEFTENFIPGPMTFWVHIPSINDLKLSNPPIPGIIPGKGYAVYYVEVEGYVFRFASLAEIRVCIETLGKKLLPNTLILAMQRGGNPEDHWLRKMPNYTKPWRCREKMVKYLAKALKAFENDCTSLD